MEDVIAPISKELLKAELTEEKRLRMTNRSSKSDIYHYCPRLSEYNERRSAVCARLHSVLREEERASLWILMNMTSWTIPLQAVDCLESGSKKFWVDTVIS